MTINTRRSASFDRALSVPGNPADPAVAGLLAVAGALAAVPQVATPAFRDGLRARLMAEAAQLAELAAAATMVPAPAAAPAPPVSPMQALAKALAKPAMQVASGGLAATIAATGVGIGASRSLPGDRLYGLREAVAGLRGGDAGTLAGAETRVNDVLALLERDGAGALGEVQATLDDLKADLDRLTADLLAQVRTGSREAYDRLHAEVTKLTDLLQTLRGRLPAGALDELDAAMSTVNATRAQLAAIPLPGGVPGLPGLPGTPGRPRPTDGPAATPSNKPVAPSTKPSSPAPTTPTTISPSEPPVAPPTMTVPPTTPLPTVKPTLPVPAPTVLP